MEFVWKMLRATHTLWMERNNILHLQTAQRIKSLEMVALETAVNQQFTLGYSDLEETDLYLLEKGKQSLMKEPVGMLWGWLCEILIAQGDFASTRLESSRDRGKISHVVPTLSATEIRKYLDWWRVCLSQRSNAYVN